MHLVTRRGWMTLAWALAGAMLGLGWGWAGAAEAVRGSESGSGGTLLVYCGRKLSFIEPLAKEFEKETGVKVKFSMGDTAQLALKLKEEGAKSPADVFWAQDAGALGDVAKAGLLAPLPKDVLERVPAEQRTPSGLWVGISGRARVLAYSPQRVKAEALPKHIADLSGAAWKGRVGWAPTNASFQAFVTAMRLKWGEDKAKAWLLSMKANGTRSYPNNVAILKAIADGEIDLGLPNHYYLLQTKAKDPGFPVAQTFFEAGDVGNLVNLSGAGVVKSSAHRADAERFIAFLLSKRAQGDFAEKLYEYPMVDDVVVSSAAVSQAELRKLIPDVNLSDLDDLPGTLKLLKATVLSE